MNDGAETRGSAWTPRRRRLLFAAALAAAAVLVLWLSPRRTPPAPQAAPRPPLPTRLEPEAITESEADREATTLPGSYRREVVRPKPVEDPAASLPDAAEAPEPESAGPLPSRRRAEKAPLPEIFRMPPGAPTVPSAARAGPTAEKAKGVAAIAAGPFAPYGRLVKCQLVNTVDSVTARSEPIVALVTEDLDWNGNVIVPAGTEAFSFARPEPILDAAGVGRLVDTGEWTLVLPGGPEGANGRELILRARAIDRREVSLSEQGQARAWAIDDGADGLIGYTLSSLDSREIKLFAAAAVSGMAQGFGAVAERQQAAAGLAGAYGATQIAPTLGNAAIASVGAGAVDYLNQLASRIRDEITKRGIYIRVPAGKEFYLFVEQTIDPVAAAVGLRLPVSGAAPR